MNKEGKIKESIQTRAAIYRCKILLAETIQDLAKHPTAEGVRSALSL